MFWIMLIGGILVVDTVTYFCSAPSEFPLRAYYNNSYIDINSYEELSELLKQSIKIFEEESKN